MIMKKQYIKPEIALYGVQLAQLLCLSRVDETEVNFGEGYPTRASKSFFDSVTESYPDEK